MKRELAALAIILALACLEAPTAWAQAHTHMMVTPGELTWTAVPSFPAGAQLAVIECPLNEAVPFTMGHILLHRDHHTENLQEIPRLSPGNLYAPSRGGDYLMSRAPFPWIPPTTGGP